MQLIMSYIVTCTHCHFSHIYPQTPRVTSTTHIFSDTPFNGYFNPFTHSVSSHYSLVSHTLSHLPLIHILSHLSLVTYYHTYPSHMLSHLPLVKYCHICDIYPQSHMVTFTQINILSHLTILTYLPIFTHTLLQDYTFHTFYPQ